ncbi:MAG: hypothetical protein E6X17_09000 [Sporomusaceae bacterium]|nr:hypothetical protein [Sporomusaceae bacterium]
MKLSSTPARQLPAGDGSQEKPGSAAISKRPRIYVKTELKKGMSPERHVAFTCRNNKKDLDIANFPASQNSEKPFDKRKPSPQMQRGLRRMILSNKNPGKNSREE